MTAQLVQAYDNAGDDRKFEAVLFNYDQEQGEMDNYMKTSKINFPGIKLSEAVGLKDLADKGSNGYLPCMVLVNTAGEVIAAPDSKQVLAKLAEL